MTALGDTVRLGAEALDGNGNPVAGAEVGWSSSDTSVAVVDASGLVTAVANGAATVTATAGAATGAAAVTVAQEASVVAVSPPAATVSIGSTVQLLAEAFDANEHLVEGAYFGWSSSNTSVVAVDPSGLVTGISEGRATVTAAAGDARGTAEITVENPDRAALVALYQTTGGANWINSENWLTDAPLGQWYGVTTAQGRVVGLDLSGYRDFKARETVLHGLAGPIPPELGSLTKLRALQLRFNELTGPIPPELGNLTDLESLILDTNYLSGLIPPELGRLANLRHLVLRDNFLTGRIPPELSNLSNLEQLTLASNTLSGPIPPELGNLASLLALQLYDNNLTGSIPPELGNLANLWQLSLFNNDLTGPIPPELATLGRLSPRGVDVSFSLNSLTGPIPPELGDLANLERLQLNYNEISGGLPSSIGDLTQLTTLSVDHNPLSGGLPRSLMALDRLEWFAYHDTELCEPADDAFQLWLSRIAIVPGRTVKCAPARTGDAMAYLVQAVQSHTNPVPLVAGERALMRVFVTAISETTEGMPSMRARLYLDGVERHVVDIPASSNPIPTEVDEGDLTKSANAEVPGWILKPGLEMVVEIDPEGTLESELGVVLRIPQTGRMGIEVREMPVFDLTVIPVVWSSNPDSTAVQLAKEIATDPEGHRLLEDTRTLLPVGQLNATAHEPLVTARGTSNADLLHRVEAIRVMESGGGYYMALTDVQYGGIAGLPGRSSVSEPTSETIAHELGHNLGLLHAPCGGARGPTDDPLFPYERGVIGAWGYDFRSGRLVSKFRKDIMGYCTPRWISDYHFTKAFRHRLSAERTTSRAVPRAPARSLLLWGGVDAEGKPLLHPAFVADAPPALPERAGDYTLIGRDAGGGELFSLSFAMPVMASEEEVGSAFAFVLPVRPEWAGALSSITLSGPDGSVTLDGRSDRPMAILRNPSTGQVRGFLSDQWPTAAVAMDAARLAAGSGLEVLFSRGIPDAEAWKR